MDDMPDELSADDARILAMESPAVMGHTLKLLVLEPGTPLDVDVLRARVAARVADARRALHRVDTSGPEPRWVPAEPFVIAAHVRRRAGAECATRADLWREVGSLMSEHLDRAQPLWTFDLLGPMADGREVVAARMHHAMVDGIAGMRFLETVLLDPLPAPVAQVGIRSADAGARGIREWRAMPAAVARELGRPEMRSPFDRPITGAREVAFAAAPVTGLREIGASRAAHATVNDVLLAIVASALGSWIGDGRRERHLRAQVPVSLHHRGDAAGNRDSFLNVDLPVRESDPLRMLDRISGQTRAAKQHDDPALMYDLLHAPGRLGTIAQRWTNSAHEFAVAISNVPGPWRPVAVDGRPVETLFSSSEPAPHHALRISAVSCADEMGIGLCTDPTVLPGVAALAAEVDDSYTRLHAAAFGGA